MKTRAFVLAALGAAWFAAVPATAQDLPRAAKPEDVGLSSARLNRLSARMQQGIARGGLKRKDDAQLHLGFALHRAGQKQRAVQVLRGVTGSDGTSDLARLWAKVP